MKASGLTTLMNMQLRYDINLVCNIILKEHLAKFGIPCLISDSGKIELSEAISLEQYQKLEAALRKYGIEIIENSRSALVQKIKDTILDLIYYPEKHSDSKLSSLLVDQLNLSYSYLSRIFSEETHTSIENYMIQERVERAKQLIMENRHTITEIAWKLNFSSVAHLSNQFKKITGLTPTLFQKIIKNRNIKIGIRRHQLTEAL
jgi:AraC-like DNA-binding protein